MKARGPSAYAFSPRDRRGVHPCSPGARDEGLDHLLRHVKLPPAGHQSGGRDQGGSLDRRRVDRGDEGHLRHRRRWEDGVLEVCGGPFPRGGGSGRETAGAPVGPVRLSSPAPSRFVTKNRTNTYRNTEQNTIIPPCQGGSPTLVGRRSPHWRKRSRRSSMGGGGRCLPRFMGRNTRRQPAGSAHTTNRIGDRHGRRGPGHRRGCPGRFQGWQRTTGACPSRHRCTERKDRFEQRRLGRPGG